MARRITDQIGAEIELVSPPKKIISVVPSQTELLWHLGLDEETIGITKFCIHPEEWFRNKTRIGGTKTLDIEKIKSLEPDLILANKEENQEDQIKELQSLFPTYVSDIFTLDDNLKMIKDVSEICGKSESGNKLIHEVQKGFSVLDNTPKGSALYLIWHNPAMAIGRHTYINDMMKRCGYENALPDQAEYTRYPEITAELAKELHPDFVFLSSEPFPFKEKHLAHYQAMFPNARIVLVDGEMFSWYGYRSVLAPAYFTELSISTIS